jgi:hydrogenase maturation protein HypF
MVIATSNDTRTRLCIRITGTVQGVGFRPYVYHLASNLSLTGFVMNDGNGVYIEIQGHNTEHFMQQIQLNVPPLAKIKTINYDKKSIIPNEEQFTIRSTAANDVMTDIGIDAAICDECIQDLFDKTNRYFHYPFIACSHCGPRYSITNRLPFDRENTSMAAFAMCQACTAEYTDPNNKRYHTQTIACAECGPQLSHSIETIAKAIKQGKIVAIKGLGGYQLICDAHNEKVVEKLRKCKERSDKPFAIMVLNEQSANQYVHVSAKEITILKSHQRPIVIFSQRENKLSKNISPGLSTLGVMLPCTPVHYLIFENLIDEKNGHKWLVEKKEVALVVTSGNNFEAPILTDDLSAKNDLADIADLIVSYNRAIVTHVDDSVIKFANEKVFFIRRARGYALESIELPYEIPTTIALGGYLKNTICITRKNEAFISQHIGKLSNVDTIKTYRETLSHMHNLLNIKPECIAHDAHPDFYSSHIALEFNLPTFAIQHHHAHLAAMAAQNKLAQPAIGLALDGFGLGEKQESWGGELMICRPTNYTRLGSLKPFAQPGGDIVVRQPWRMAASILFELNKLSEIQARFSSYQSSELVALLKKSSHSPISSSCGRLFDAASALLNICKIATYEGQAAMMLESKVTIPTIADHSWHIIDNQLNLLPLFEKLLNCNQVDGANLFHGTLAAALAEWVVINATKLSLTHVLLAGGCFLNSVLLELVTRMLKQFNLKPVFPDFAIPNDAGLSLGQAWIAGNKMMEY